MQVAILYVVTAALFLSLDFIALTRLIRPLFETHVSDLLRSEVRLVAAVVFYLAYVAGIIYFASLPALRDDSPGSAMIDGALLGAIAYGTFEFTAFAVLKGWHWRMLVADVLWGTLLTGVSAWLGVVIVRGLFS